MESELYLDLDTLIHRFDPRTKIFVMLTMFVVILYYEKPLWVFSVSILILVYGIVSRSLVNLKRLRHVLIVLGTSSLIMWAFFSSGDTKLFWFIEVEALQYSISRTLVMLSMVTAGIIFISTTRNEEFIIGMIKLGLPYRVGFAISTALRLVPTIVGNVFTIAQAQRSRGLDLDSGNLIERVRKYIPLLIPVFISTIRNTNIFGMALEAKGFGAREDRTYYLETNYKINDRIMFAILIVVFAVATYLNSTGMDQIKGLIRF